MNDIFRQIAKENGTTEKAVKEEMQFAIREAMKSAEPEAIAFWKAVAPDGKEPPIEKVIAMIALNVNAYLDEEDCIISSSYTVFEVENKEELDPEYLMLWFSRPEFDRYARYKSHGSVREIFDWNELCMVELPVPDIEKQRKIVKAYKTLTDRIALKQQINDNLAA